jgi:hypothetical protein
LSIGNLGIVYFSDISNFPDILGRIKALTGKKYDKDVAKILGLEPNHLSNIKRTAAGKITTKGQSKNLPFKQLIDWAVENSVDLNWLFTGKYTYSEPVWSQSLHHLRSILDSLNKEESAALAESIEASLKLKGLRPPGRKETQCRPTGAQKRKGGRGGC